MTDLIIEDAKPRIRRDIFCAGTWVCWSRVWGPTWKGAGYKRKIATGSTMRDAYENWKAK